MNFIDLFAGAGGLSEGFIRAGFKPIAHVEMDSAACFTLKTRTAYHYLKATGNIKSYIKYLKGEINRQQLYSLIPSDELNSVINLPLGNENNTTIFKKIDARLKNKSVDLIIGGPPCQAYSLVGRARSKDGMENDPRNYLYLHYAKFLKKYTPKFFVFENVLGLLSAGGGSYYEKMKVKFEILGYRIKEYQLNAKDFGVLQNRKRVILIGYNEGLNITLPDFASQTNFNYKVEAIFDDLKKLTAGDGDDKNGVYTKPKNNYLRQSFIRNGISVLTQHISRPHSDQDKQIYKIAVKQLEQGERLDYNTLPDFLKTHKNRSTFRDRFKVVDSNAKHSQTVVAHISKDGHHYIHPDLAQNRSISVREAARLQSFPDDFYFEGVKENKNRTAAFKQIGNAVPPLMAQVIAKKLKETLQK